MERPRRIMTSIVCACGHRVRVVLTVEGESRVVDMETTCAHGRASDGIWDDETEGEPDPAVRRFRLVEVD